MSNETKFTPGPWWVSRHESPIGAAVVTSSHTPACSETEIQFYGGNLVAESLTPENAYLIAVAPAMYGELMEARAVLQSLIDDGYSGYVTHRVRIDALLAKARGES